MSAGGLCRRDDGITRCIRKAIGNVLLDAAGKQKDILAHEGNRVTKIFKTNLCCIVLIEGNVPLGWRIKAHEQFYQRAFAGARRADKCYRLAAGDAKIKVTENFCAVGIRKGYIAKFNGSLNSVEFLLPVS